MITPRKAEVAGVVALLESDQFDTPEQMAGQIIKLVADVLSQRTTHGVAVGMPGGKPALAIGPLYSVRDARRTNSEYGMTVLDEFTPGEDVISILNRAFKQLTAKLREAETDRDEAWATIERMMHGASS